jgi:hypothetical protein
MGWILLFAGFVRTGCQANWQALLVTCLVHSSTLKMEPLVPSEDLPDVRRHIPEDSSRRVLFGSLNILLLFHTKMFIFLTIGSL